MRILAGAVAAALLATPCAAESPYQLDPAREWTLTAAGAALGVASLVWIGQIDGFTPEELANLDASTINSFDRNGMHAHRADDAADLLAAGTYLLPFTLLADGDLREDWRTLGVMWGEAILLNIGVNGIVKAATQRTRPYAYYTSTPMDKQTSNSARLSFYSGHTSGAALNCVFTARILSEQTGNTAAKILLWTAAATVPVVVGIARVDSGNHFRSDVIVGCAAGAAIGWLVPELHRGAPERVSLRPASVFGGSALQVSVAF